MRVLIALDSFKGSITSLEAGRAVEKGIKKVNDSIETKILSIADGGEGSLDALADITGLEHKIVETIDLQRRDIFASYAMHEQYAFIESAKIIGLDMAIIGKKARTTIGLARVVKDAIENGAKKIVIFLGGSGTSDGGIDFYESLLGQIPDDVELVGATDVTNPYSGENGYANVFASQKGYSKDEIEDQMTRSAFFNMNAPIDLNAIPGTGAAGGLGGAICLLGGTLKSGFDIIAEHNGFIEEAEKSDVIFTGEGKMDAQSVDGKLVAKVAQIAKKFDKPVIALNGTRAIDIGDLDDLLTVSLSIIQKTMPLSEAMKKKHAKEQLELSAFEIMKLIWKLKGNVKTKQVD